MPSFWANRYKVARYGRTRCLALHKREIEEDPQYERRIHELTGEEVAVPLSHEPVMSRGQSHPALSPGSHRRSRQKGHRQGAYFS